MTIQPIHRHPAVSVIRHAVGCSMVVAGATLALLGAFVAVPLAIGGASTVLVGYGVSRRWTRPERARLASRPNLDYERKAA